MYIKKAIELAMKEGWDDTDYAFKRSVKVHEEASDWKVWKVGIWEYDDRIFLDPNFWSSLGKSLGWKSMGIWQEPEHIEYMQWMMEWHRFINHLIAGKDAESFFKDLIK